MRSTITMILIAMTAAAGPAMGWTPDRPPPLRVDVAGSEAFGAVTQVVLMRHGTRTVLSIQRDHEGPLEAFAMVIPVPAVLRAADVKTLPRALFTRIDQVGAPELVEAWPQDTCMDRPAFVRPPPLSAIAAGVPDGSVAQGRPGVTIESQFIVGEYQIAIVSATGAAGLAAWLRAEKYRIPSGAEAILKRYLALGMKFVAVKVDPAKVTFENGRAALSPLRLHYDSDEFTLPIGLGLAMPDGPQDLIVTILSPMQAYKVAGREHVEMPAALYPSQAALRDRFDEFYAAEFDRVQTQHHGAVVTEKTWDLIESPWHMDVGPEGLATLGLDVLGGVKETDLELTRLHARYSGAITEDLVFEPVSGLNTAWTTYVIEHPGMRPGACKERWTGPHPAEPPPHPAEPPLVEATTPPAKAPSGCTTGRFAALAGAGGLGALALVLRRRRRRDGQKFV